MISSNPTFVKPRVRSFAVVFTDPDSVVRTPVIEEVIRLKRDDHMNCIYFKDGEKDVNEYINSFANGCSLKSILSRCQLMPIHDKVRYLQQTEVGVSADLTNIPNDATEAFIMLRDLKEKHPDLIDRFSKGESFDSIVKSLLPTENKIENVETKGDIENGTV